ncbi:SDR family NAD(P)-dependent oxidoreductase [Variovorax sp.]|jgi:2-deoxy-D-gluconate 3-dehydrogenase|uniref:SDR family NAD(P)-dependent oxidoreductase n=1 Tax=Variovorax sp. TaxID=1871043 RepID=UPI0037D9BC1B
MFDLGGKVALVTGGNGGLGLGMAQGLARAGARVVIAARNPEKSAAAVETLKALGSDSFAVAIDVADEASVQQAVDAVATRCGRLDILVNNAGTTVRKPVDQLTLDEWNLVLQTNLTSAFLVSRAAHPHMQRGGGGKIVNVGSMMSIFGAAYSPAYAASKAGVVQLTKSTALSWAADNIQVNAILPGWFQTEMTDGARTQVAGLYERVVARTAAGRWGRPADIAGTAVFLASPAADYVTGVSIPVDGGYSTMG